MKFLIIQHIKDSFCALPEQKQAELMAGAFAFGEKYLKSGKCTNSHIFADFSGNASVWEIETAEEDSRIYFEYPLHNYVEMKRITVLDYESAGKIMKEMMAAAQKRAKK